MEKQAVPSPGVKEPKVLNFTLPLAVQKALLLDETAPFANDTEYFHFLEAIVLTRIIAYNIKNGIYERVFSVKYKEFGNFTSESLMNGSKLGKLVEGLTEKLVGIRKQKLEAPCPLLNRVERLYKKLEVSDFEKTVFELYFCFSMTDTCAMEFNSGYLGGRSHGLNSFAYTRILGFPVLDIMSVFSPTSKFVKANILTSTLSPRDDVGHMSEGNALALMGAPLTSAQFLSIESQVIQSLVSEEPGFENTAAGKCNELKATGNDGQANSPRAKADFKSMESLYTLLKKEEKEKISEGRTGKRKRREQERNSSSESEDQKRQKSEEDKADVPEDADADAATAAPTEKPDDIELTPYKNDLGYLQDQMSLTTCYSRICKLMKSIEEMGEFDDDDTNGLDRFENDLFDHATGRMLGKEQAVQKKESSLRKLKQKERVLRGKIHQRLAITRSQGGWFPRLERLVEALSLSSFEKFVLMHLIGTVISPNVNNNRMVGGVRKCKSSVNEILTSFCSNLEEQIECRKYFYKTSILVKEGILNMLGQDFMSDLTDCEVEIDRRMLDFVVGLDTEFSEIVDGSHLYTPVVAIEDVILPEDMKALVMDTVSNFERLKQVEKELEVDKKISYGRGMALLFYGASGTGKTMLANALATKLNRRILLINFPTLGTNEAGVIIKLIFREAKIHNAIIFFDECESLFQNRDVGSRNVNMILTELERHDGLSIMATNRPSDLDEAMYRRITLALEFRKPDHILRERIWKSLRPPLLKLNDDVVLGELALKFELTGGFIKNTWLSALSFAVSRDGDNPVVCQEDLRKAASHQLRGRLSMVDFDRRIIPSRGLDDIILPDDLKSILQDIVNFGKAQSILFGQWGFSKQHGGSKGIGALFHGPPGTGKTMAAEAIGYDLGRPLKVVNCAQLISKWVGESAKNIQTVFDEAKAVDAILVFDEAESVFGSRGSDGDSGSSRHDTMNVGILLHHIETFPGVVIVITNIKEKIDNAFFRRFKFVMEFPKPSAQERLRLWNLLIPKEAPLAPNVDVSSLAQKYEFAGGNIKTVVFRAASRAALRNSIEDRVITMEDLRKACEEEQDKDGGSKASVYSMYT